MSVDVRTGLLQWVINGPGAHRWHHAVDADAHGLNFATKLALWADSSARRSCPPAYGLGPVEFPRGHLGQQFFAFRPFR